MFFLSEFPRVGNEYTPTATGKPDDKTRNFNIIWRKQIIKLQDKPRQRCSVVIALYYCASLCEIFICAAVSHILTIIPQTPVVRFSCYVRNGRKVQAQNKVSKVQFRADWRTGFGQHGAVCILTWRLSGPEETFKVRWWWWSVSGPELTDTGFPLPLFIQAQYGAHQSGCGARPILLSHAVGWSKSSSQPRVWGP